MKLFLSPSKTMNEKGHHEPLTQPIYAKQAQKLRTILCGLDQTTLADQFKLSQKQVEQVQRYYAHQLPIAAIDMYKGSVFQQLALDTYTTEQKHYLQAHVCILSAVYGMLSPFDAILPYRLDLKQSLPQLGMSLTTYWQTTIQQAVDNEVCINLASNEFAKVLPNHAITIDFVERYVDGKPKRLATYAKIARGQFIHTCICEQISTVEQLQLIKTQRYYFSPEYSTATKYVYLAKL
ncbi:MAG: YaaA family protein [Culicoidibacterales bacterium]